MAGSVNIAARRTLNENIAINITRPSSEPQSGAGKWVDEEERRGLVCPRCGISEQVESRR